MSIERLVNAVASLKEKVSLIPAFAWGTITSKDPLTVELDGETSGISVNECFGIIEVDARVLCVLVGRRVYAWSAAKPIPPPPPPVNTIRINGKDYPASGSLAVQVGSFPYWDGKIAATTLQIPFPVDLPQGWTFEMFSLHSWSFSVVQTGEVDRSTRRINARMIQFYANSVNALSRVGWRLVKE